MHEPRTHGLATYGGKLTDDDLGFIDRYCKIVTNVKTVSGLESIKYTRELPDGGFVIIQDAGGVFRAITYKPSLEKEFQIYDGVVHSKIPMLFSGVIDKGIAYDGQGIDIKLTNACAMRLGQYEQAVSRNVSLQRFRCEYDELNKIMFVPEALQYIDPERVLYTQYDKLKATWYSGAMAETVQIVSGFGRQDFENLPEDPVERMQMRIPESVRQKTMDELQEGSRLPGYYGFPRSDGKIKYSFTFYNTHLVSFDSANKPWLVQVDSSGVWAMPLPVIPATMTMAFHEYISEVGDAEIQAILDRFGAIPSGEVFPEGADFHRWVRAGVIIKICDTADFYSHSPYSSVCGWSCDSMGHNLINTCFDFEGDICYGYTYQIRLRLGAAENRGVLKTVSLSSLSADRAVRVSRYLSELFGALPPDTDPKTATIKYKIRRVDVSEIESRAGSNGARDVDYWDNYTCTPIASHSGSISRTNRGTLYGGSQFKLPEPFFQGCINQNFNPRNSGSDRSYPKSDTIVFGYYIGDTLKVVKSFYDDRKAIREEESNFIDVMTVGSWEKTEYLGWTGLAGHVYTTDFDHRREITPTEKYTRIIGTDKGYGTPEASYYAAFWTDGELRRSRYYTHKTNVTTKTDGWLDESVVVPYYNRNAILYVQQDGAEYEEQKETLKMHGVLDPNQYRFWTYDDNWHSINNSVKRTGTPFPVNAAPCWAEIHYYRSQGEISDFADQGDWIGALPADIAHYVNPPGAVTITSYGGVPPTVEEYEDVKVIPSVTKNEMHFSGMDTNRKVHERGVNSQFYTNSPDAWGNVLYEDACKVVFGSTKYANISVKDENNRRYRFGSSLLADGSTAHTFIGVINE